MFLLFAIVATVALICLWFKKKFSYWEKLGFPSVAGKFPFGSVRGMGTKIHFSELLQKFYGENKGKAPAVGFYLLTQPVLLPTEPELVKDIFVRNFDSFHDRGFYFNEKDDPLSNHLFFLSGQKWKDLRAKLSPTFTSGKIKMMFGNVTTICDKMIDFLAPSADCSDNVEIKDVLSSFTTEVISNVAFGLDVDCLGNPDNEFRIMANAVFEPKPKDKMKILMMNAFPKAAKFFGLAMNNKETTNFFMEVIRKNVEHRESKNIQRNDFLQLLIQMKDSESGLTFSEIAANSFVFFLAG